MNVTIQTIQLFEPTDKAYSIMSTLKNHLASINPTSVAGVVEYEFDVDDAIGKFRELYLSDRTNDKQAAAYWGYIELLKKIKEVV